MYMCKYLSLIIQVEAHVYLQQEELLSVCNELKIVMTAFAPLTSPGDFWWRDQWIINSSKHNFSHFYFVCCEIYQIV